MINLAFLWHFHQPSYLDIVENRLMMPWVRLHGAKDYSGMAALLEEFPAIHATANFSPCLLDQFLAYGTGVQDTVLETVRRDPETLDEEQKRFLRRQLFFAHPDRHIGIHPRYQELRDKERRNQDFTRQEWIDLETLNAFVWIHPLIVEKDAGLQALARKGRIFTIEERDRVLDRHLSLVAGVIPRWKALQDAGRVEVSVSPYYHPILPLLCDFEAAHQALPSHPLPPLGTKLAGDAARHVMRARQRGREIFGREPNGCWPSEGSVSPEACALLAKHGFKWFATDEAILHHADGSASIHRPHPVGDGAIAGMFRDTALSNLLGFTYKGWSPNEAVEDFVHRLEYADQGGEKLVVVALDGENAWEHYADNAVPFFRELYRRLSNHPRIRTVTMTEAIDRVPPSEPVARIWSGSWINHNFGVWMGHEEDRRGWELLGRVRDAVVAAKPPAPAIEAIDQAEGSDWFWWFGDDYSSPQDAEFDAIFRLHLSNACSLAGIPSPADLARPIKSRRHDDLIRPPADVVQVIIDGKSSSFFEWAPAGRYDLSREFGAMSGDLAVLAALRFGVDERRIAVRLDFRSGVKAVAALGAAELSLVLTRPHDRAIRIHPPDAGVETGVDEIFECAVPFEKLGLAPGADAEFHLEVRLRGGRPVQIPALAPLVVKIPAADHRMVNWRL